MGALLVLFCCFVVLLFCCFVVLVLCLRFCFVCLLCLFCFWFVSSVDYAYGYLVTLLGRKAFTLVSASSALISITSYNLYNDLAEAIKALEQKKGGGLNSCRSTGVLLGRPVFASLIFLAFFGPKTDPSE